MRAVLTSCLTLPWHRDLQWAVDELTLQQKKMTELAEPGVLLAYTLEDGHLTVPKCWGLLNKDRLGITDIDDRQPVGEQAHAELSLPSLRPHQSEALTAIRNQLLSTEHGGGCVLVLSCGMGKTVTALAVAASLKAKTLIIVNTSVLLKQWMETIEQYVPDAIVGQIRQSKCEVEGRTHVVALLQSLVKRNYCLDSFQLLCLDEVHRTCAPLMSKVVQIAGCRWKLGLTATPLRADNLSRFLEIGIGPVAYEQHREKSTDLRAFAILLSSGPTRMLTLRKAGKDIPNIAKMINLLEPSTPRALARQQLAEAWLLLCCSKGRKVIVLADRIELLKDLQKRVDTALSTCFVIGSAKQAERDRAHSVQVIFASYGAASEGFDCPSLDTILYLTPRSGVSVVTQTVGRLMRQGGRSPLVIDFVDAVPLFVNMHLKRRGVYKKLGATITYYDEQRCEVAPP